MPATLAGSLSKQLLTAEPRDWSSRGGARHQRRDWRDPATDRSQPGDGCRLALELALRPNWCAATATG